MPGLGLLDISSGRGDRRGVGEITADVDPALGVERLTGFENHQGVTRRGPDAKPLATVVTGVGNGDGTEGAYSGRVVGTYLHGPALVRNPSLADMLLGWVVGTLPPVDPRQEDLVLKLRAERLAAQGTPGLSKPWGQRTGSVDQGLGALGHHLGDERGRPGDPDAVDQVVGPDVPAGRALGAYRHRTRGQDPGQQVGQRRGVREREVRGRARGGRTRRIRR